MGFKDTLQEIVNKPFAEKVSGAKLALNRCFEILTGHNFNKEEATIVLVTFLSAAVASDGRFTAPEREMIDILFNSPIDSILRGIDTETYGMMDQLVDTLDPEEKSTFCLLAIFVAAVDDTINRDELTYIIKLME